MPPLSDEPLIVYFATKDDWRRPSQLTWIAEGLPRLEAQLRRLGMISVALPWLGCGLGGLRRQDVRPLIEAAFGASPVTAVVYTTAR